MFCWPVRSKVLEAFFSSHSLIAFFKGSSKAPRQLQQSHVLDSFWGELISPVGGNSGGPDIGAARQHSRVRNDFVTEQASNNTIETLTLL